MTKQKEKAGVHPSHDPVVRNTYDGFMGGVVECRSCGETLRTYRQGLLNAGALPCEQQGASDD